MMWKKEFWAVTFLLSLLAVRVYLGDLFQFLRAAPRRFATLMASLVF